MRCGKGCRGGLSKPAKKRRATTIDESSPLTEGARCGNVNPSYRPTAETRLPIAQAFAREVRRMTWMDPNACQGDRRYECTYLTIDGGQQWCEDHDDGCPSWSRGAPLFHVKDNDAGGW